MKVLLDGQAKDSVTADDRGLHYGDGLFETIPWIGGQPRLWQAHMERLRRGCRALRIEAPPAGLLREELTALAAGHDHATAKIIITRSGGRRGYRGEPGAPARRLLMLTAPPDYPHSHWHHGVRVRLCHLRLAAQPRLAGIKHLNRLEHVLARMEWDDTAIAEGLLRDQAGRLIEGVMSNLFIVRGGGLLTPDLSACGVAGVMRGYILQIAKRLGIAYRIGTISLDDLKEADEVFLSNSLIGIWPVREVDCWRYDTGANSVTRRLLATLAPECFAPV